MAASPDQFRIIYFQGHPEYDATSLLKEYKREVKRFLAGELDEAPPFPENYFPTEAAALARAGVESGDIDAVEKRIEALLDNTWGDTARAIINNWLGLVYQFTHLDRKQQFMPGTDPEDPLGLAR
jgi:homoserine O-succinyltransferase